MGVNVFEPLVEEATTSKRIVDQIVDLVATGKLKVGDKLPPERDLAQLLGVGRSSVREALKSMTNMGLLTAKRSEGTFIKKADSESLRTYFQWNVFLETNTLMDLIEAREVIELTIITKVAKKHTEDDIRSLRGTVRAMEEGKDSLEKTTKSDIDFHTTLVNVAGNSILQIMIELIRSAMETWFKHVLSNKGNLEATISEHTEIIDAIEAHDELRATNLLKVHLARGAERLQKALEE